MSRISNLKPGCVALLIAMTATCASAQSYKAIGEYKLPGASATGIAVDTAGRRLYVAGDTGVAVLHADTGAAQGTLAGTAGAQDVLVVPVMDDEAPGASITAFASTAAGVVSIDLASGKTGAPVKMEAAGFTSLCYDPMANTIVAVSSGDSLALIDAASGKLIKSGKLHTGAGQVACGIIGKVYVADTAMNVVHVLSTATMKNLGDYPIMTGSKPSGMTLDTKGRRLFVACEDGTIEIIDTDSGFTFIELKSGSGAAHGTFAWVPQGKGQWKAAAFFTHADGTLSGVRMNAFINYTLGGEWTIAPGIGAVAYDAKTHHLFTTAMHGGSPVVTVLGY
jgi:DNA-binding beta-propeller fold protein YncE